MDRGWHAKGGEVCGVAATFDGAVGCCECCGAEADDEGEDHRGGDECPVAVGESESADVVESVESAGRFEPGDACADGGGVGVRVDDDVDVRHAGSGGDRGEVGCESDVAANGGSVAGDTGEDLAGQWFTDVTGVADLGE